VAGGTTARTTTFGNNAIDHVVHGTLHHRIAAGDFDFVYGAIMADIGNYWHMLYYAPGSRFIQQ
jgi:hypothetical protein